MPIGQFFDHISGTGSRLHDQFTLDLCPLVSFQTRPNLPKSVQSSPRKRCEFSRNWPISHFFDYISGTGSRRHDLFTLDLWPLVSFQTRPNLSKSVQSSPRKRCEKKCTHIRTHRHTHTYTHTDIFPISTS